MATAYLGLGSNIGDRSANLETALELLGREPKIRVDAVSSFLETAPVGYTDQPDFLNAVMRVETELAPRELLAAVVAVELEMGRVRTIRWGPRVIDIDILIYDALAVDEPDLQVPHPRMMERLFVLEPLAEIAPDLVLPGAKTAAEAANELRAG